MTVISKGGSQEIILVERGRRLRKETTEGDKGKLPSDGDYACGLLPFYGGPKLFGEEAQGDKGTAGRKNLGSTI